MALVQIKNPPRAKGPFVGFNHSVKHPSAAAILNPQGVYTPNARRRRTHNQS